MLLIGKDVEVIAVTATTSLEECPVSLYQPEVQCQGGGHWGSDDYRYDLECASRAVRRFVARVYTGRMFKNGPGSDGGTNVLKEYTTIYDIFK